MVKFFRLRWFEEDWHPTEDELIDYADGQVLAKQATEIRAHLETCWSCRMNTEKIQESISSFVDYLNNAFATNIESPPCGWRRFDGHLSRRVTAAGRQSLLSHVRSSFGKVFSAPTFSVRLATGFLVLLLLGFLVNRFQQIPAVSASQILQQAKESQARQIRAIPQPVVYQKLQVRRKTNAPLRDSTLIWEIWNDASNDRFKQRVEDVHGQQFIDSQLENGVAGGSETSQGLHRQPEQKNANAAVARNRQLQSSTLPPILQELEQIFQTNRMDRRSPLSPTAYGAWRRSVQRKSEEVRPTNLPDGERALTLITAAGGPFAANAIIQAELVVRAEDWHPVEQRLRVQVENGFRDYELTETAFQVLALSTLDPSIFADTNLTHAPITISRVPIPSPVMSPTASELIAAEIEADYALHRVKACLASISTVLETTNICGDKQGVRQNREPGACHRTRAWAWGIGSARRLQDTGCEPVCRA